MRNWDPDDVGKIIFVVGMMLGISIMAVSNAVVENRQAAAMEACVAANPGNAESCVRLFKAVKP